MTDPNNLSDHLHQAALSLASIQEALNHLLELTDNVARDLAKPCRYKAAKDEAKALHALCNSYSLHAQAGKLAAQLSYLRHNALEIDPGDRITRILDGVNDPWYVYESRLLEALARSDWRESTGDVWIEPEVQGLGGAYAYVNVIQRLPPVIGSHYDSIFTLVSGAEWGSPDAWRFERLDEPVAWEDAP